MGIKTKLTLACTFVAMVATAATAFGQTGSTPAPKDGSGDTPRARRAAPAERRDGDQCATPRGGRRLVHRESKFKAESGFAVRTIDQGEITAIDHSAKKITIRRLDGETIRATATDDTKVCKEGKPAAFSALKVGDIARLMSVRSTRVTGLRRIAAVTPRSEKQRNAPARGASDVSEGDPLELSA